MAQDSLRFAAPGFKLLWREVSANWAQGVLRQCTHRSPSCSDTPHATRMIEVDANDQVATRVDDPVRE